MRTTGRQSGFEPRPSAHRGRVGAPDALQVATRDAAGEAGRGDGNSYPGAGRLASQSAHYTQDEPGQCWAVRFGQREVHDLRACEHYLPFPPPDEED